MKNAGVENNKLLYYDVDNKIWRCIMKAHKYWSIGAIVTMVGTFYTGYKGLKEAQIVYYSLADDHVKEIIDKGFEHLWQK